MNNVSGSIRWADFSWNPITGCYGGCGYCYGRRIAHRFGQDFTPTLHEDRLNEPARRKKPSKVFVCSMSDLLGNGVKIEWIWKVVDAINAAPWHTYQILTKHPARYEGFAANAIHPLDPGIDIWFGATATDQMSWEFACDRLKRLSPDATRWVSAEPMLGYISPSGWLPDWVVVGALTGHGRKKQERSAAKGIALSDFLRAHRVPVFEKDSLGRDRPLRFWPERLTNVKTEAIKQSEV